MSTILLTAYIIILIIPLLYIAYKRYQKHYTKRRTQYREHIDHLVTELFPPATPAIPAIPTQAVNTYTPTANEPDPQEATVQYQETKRKMIADIRTYFNQRKINAAIAKIPGPDELAPVNPSAGYEDLSFPTPPSIERLME